MTGGVILIFSNLLLHFVVDLVARLCLQGVVCINAYSRISSFQLSNNLSDYKKLFYVKTNAYLIETENAFVKTEQTNTKLFTPFSLKFSTKVPHKWKLMVTVCMFYLVNPSLVQGNGCVD